MGRRHDRLPSFWPSPIKGKLVDLASLDEVQHRHDRLALGPEFVDGSSIEYLSKEERQQEQAACDLWWALAPSSLTSAVVEFENDESIFPPCLRNTLPPKQSPYATGKVPCYALSSQLNPPKRNPHHSGTDTPTFPSLPSSEKLRRYDIHGSHRTELTRRRTVKQQRRWLRKAQLEALAMPMWPTHREHTSADTQGSLPSLAQDFKAYMSLMERFVTMNLTKGDLQPRSQTTLHPLIEAMMPIPVKKARDRKWVACRTNQSRLETQQALEWQGLFPTVTDELIDVPQVDVKDVLEVLYPLVKPLPDWTDELRTYAKGLENAKRTTNLLDDAPKEPLKVGGYYLRKR